MDSVVVVLVDPAREGFPAVLTAIPLWAAFVLGRRAATRRFTYGYGWAEDLAGVFIVLMIAASALVAGYESVRRMLDPSSASSITVAILVVLRGQSPASGGV